MYRTICVTVPVGDLYVSEYNGCIVQITKQTLPVTESSEVLKMCTKQLNEYFAHQRKEFDLPLSFTGSRFQCAVWQAMQDVEYGECISYKQLAEKAGYPDALRAVGTACGKNPIAIVIPCHRIIKSDGKTGNYAWGTEMKQFLIDLEKEKTR